MPRYLLQFALSDTPLQCARALLQSFVAVLSCAAVGGVVFLPAEVHRLEDHPSHSILGYGICGESRYGVALVRTLPSHTDVGLRLRLFAQDFPMRRHREIALPREMRPVCMATSDARGIVFLGDENGTVSGVDVRLAVGAGAIGRHLRGTPHAMSLSSDGRTLMSIDREAIYAWDIPRWNLRWCRFSAAATCIEIAPQGQSVICQVSEETHLRIIELDGETGDLRCELPGGNQPVHDIAISPDCRSALGIGFGGTLFVWRRETPSAAWQLRSMPHMRSGFVCVTASFSPDSRLLVMGDEDDRGVTIWNVVSGELVRRLDAGDDYTLGARFLNDRQVITWSSDGRTCLWQWEDGTLLWSERVPPVISASPRDAA
ncbi:MAG: WD40 repeat domain-containing protein [Pirellulaceae bacterium]